MSAERMCELGRVSRAGLYRFDPGAEYPDKDLDLRDEIQRIALAFPCYGRPRVTAELKRRGWKVNHKRVGRILREMRGRPGHIFNLGHGVPPHAKLENIESLVSAVRSFK